MCQRRDTVRGRSTEPGCGASWVIPAEFAAGGRLDTAGVVEACSAGVPDDLTAAVVFVVGCDAAGAFVQPHRGVVAAKSVESGFELAGVGDLLQTRPLAL